jgi:hypothetical protein
MRENSFRLPWELSSQGSWLGKKISAPRVNSGIWDVVLFVATWGPPASCYRLFAGTLSDKKTFTLSTPEGISGRILWPSAYISTYLIISLFFILCVQGVPGRKVKILGGHNVGHSKQKLYMYMCPIPNSFPNRVISLYSSKIVHKKEILRTVSSTCIYCSSDKVDIVFFCVGWD